MGRSVTPDNSPPSRRIWRYSRYRDGRPLLAICTDELEESDAVFLEFFELDSHGEMRLAKRGIFPVKDGKGRSFELPRQGRTVVVREGGKVVRRVTWDGEEFTDGSREAGWLEKLLSS